MNPARADALVDLVYGGLIALAIVLIATVDTNVGIAFGVGVFAAYVVHVVWKMVRFDPDWMTRTVRETVEETVGDSVERTVEESVEQTVEESVGETVEQAMGDQLDEVQERVESLDERVEGTPRADEVGDADEATDSGEGADDTRA
nr:hypothetical protein [Halosimplex carlsbadense]